MQSIRSFSVRAALRLKAIINYKGKPDPTLEKPIVKFGNGIQKMYPDMQLRVDIHGDTHGSESSSKDKRSHASARVFKVPSGSRVTSAHVYKDGTFQFSSESFSDKYDKFQQKTDEVTPAKEEGQERENKGGDGSQMTKWKGRLLDKKEATRPSNEADFNRMGSNLAKNLRLCLVKNAKLRHK